MGNVAIRNNELRNQFPKKILQKNARDEQVRARLYSLFQVDDCFPFFEGSRCFFFLLKGSSRQLLTTAIWMGTSVTSIQLRSLSTGSCRGLA